LAIVIFVFYSIQEMRREHLKLLMKTIVKTVLVIICLCISVFLVNKYSSYKKHQVEKFKAERAFANVFEIIHDQLIIFQMRNKKEQKIDLSEPNDLQLENYGCNSIFAFPETVQQINPFVPDLIRDSQNEYDFLEREERAQKSEDFTLNYEEWAKKMIPAGLVLILALKCEKGT
jgi:hypothetical protein